MRIAAIGSAVGLSASANHTSVQLFAAKHPLRRNSVPNSQPVWSMVPYSWIDLTGTLLTSPTILSNRSKLTSNALAAIRNRCTAMPSTEHERTVGFAKKYDIRLSGPPLGRPPKKTLENTQELRDRKLQQRQDELDRVPIEGKFGQSKRRFSLNLVMAKLADTSETAIAIIFIVMDLEKWLQKLLFGLLWRFRLSTKLHLQTLHTFMNRYFLTSRSYCWYCQAHCATL